MVLSKERFNESHLPLKIVHTLSNTMLARGLKWEFEVQWAVLQDLQSRKSFYQLLDSGKHSDIKNHNSNIMKSISTFNQLANSVWSSFVLAELVACIKHANSEAPHPNNWSTNPSSLSQYVLPFLSHTSVRQDEQRRVWNFNIEMFFSFGLEAFNE